jgi:hypothetical protein
MAGQVLVCGSGRPTRRAGADYTQFLAKVAFLIRMSYSAAPVSTLGTQL